MRDYKLPHMSAIYWYASCPIAMKRSFAEESIPRNEIMHGNVLLRLSKD